MVSDNLLRKTILIVEDNDLNREILKSILGDKYNILETTNGQEGLNVLKEKKEHISLVLLDIQMPVLDGYGFLEEVQKDDKLMQIPVIVTTSDPQEEEKALSCGASDFVQKPYSPNILIKRVEALIRLRDSISALSQAIYDTDTNCFSREYFSYYVDYLSSNNVNKSFTAIVLEIPNFGYLSRALSNNDITMIIKFIGEVVTSISNDFIVCRYEKNQFCIVFEKNAMKWQDAVDAIKKGCIFNSRVAKLVLKFAVYENFDYNTKINVIISKLESMLDQIEHDYLEETIIFDDKMVEYEKKVNLIESNMRDGLNNSDFKVFYQPKHDGYNGKLVGAEALIRWVHPVYGFISPGDFIPVFEDNGFITELDIFVLEKTCEFIKSLKEQGLKPVPISINLSRRDLVIIQNLNKIDSILEKYGVEKNLIHFEVTESTCGDGEQVISKAKMIRDGGYNIEIDDFGSGYSSLGMISDIPMDYIKLDISFTRRLETQEKVVEAIIKLAHDIGVKTIAEGVETQEQIDTYKRLGNDYIQGYFYSKPLSSEELTIYLKGSK